MRLGVLGLVSGCDSCPVPSLRPPPRPPDSRPPLLARRQTDRLHRRPHVRPGLSPSATYSQNGKTGVSPRIALDVSRIDLRGTNNSLTLHSTYGLLEEVANLT